MNDMKFCGGIPMSPSVNNHTRIALFCWILSQASLHLLALWLQSYIWRSLWKVCDDYPSSCPFYCETGKDVIWSSI